MATASTLAQSALGALTDSQSAFKALTDTSSQGVTIGEING